eukprot:5063137-Amphidinium_carterae.1
MHGGTRAKHTLLRASPGLLDKLALACDGSHSHASWGRQSGAWATVADNAETSYPQVLCQRWAGCLLDFVVQRGAAAPAKCLEEQPTCHSHVRHRLQASSCRQGHRHLPPPLVAEYSQVLVLPSLSHDPLHHLLRTEVERDGGVRFVHGVLRDAREFVNATGAIQHPFDLDATLPPALLHSLGSYLSSHPARVVQGRADYLGALLHKREGVAWETFATLAMGAEGGNFPRPAPCERDIIEGFRTMGKARRSPLYPAALVPPGATEEDFWRNAKWKRAWRATRSSSDQVATQTPTMSCGRRLWTRGTMAI